MQTKNGPLKILDQSLLISNNQVYKESKKKVPRILGVKSPGRMGIIIESSALPQSRIP
jgi:hypothetical protein